MIKILYLFIFSTLFSTFSFAETNDNRFNFAGVGAIVSTSPYEGVSTKTRAVPFLFMEYKGFYIKGIEAGYHFIDKGSWTVSVITSPRFMGYSAGDSDILEGMEDRKMSLDAGVKATYTLPGDMGAITAKALADVLSRSDGAVYELAWGREFKGGIFRLSPSFGVRYLDEALVDYYYGVRDVEARVGREAYAPHGAADPFADVLFTCGLSKRLIVVTRVGAEFLGRAVRKSPLVDESYVLTAAAGLTYRF